jgi:lipopolysaccharide assembly outer membrane protein LptD (OstA)
VFIERLQVTGQFGYNETGVKLNGGGVLIVEKNAEDVYTGTSVTVSKGDFTFKASGLEYNEDKNRLILSGGSALIPKLEGAKNSRDKANYDFDGLSFDLNQGVFLQLKLQQGKLRAGAVPMSTGTRSAAPQQEKLNPSAPQNTPTKTDTTT